MTEEKKAIPDYQLSKHLFVLRNPSLKDLHAEAKEALMTAIFDRNLAGVYKSLYNFDQSQSTETSGGVVVDVPEELQGQIGHEGESPSEDVDMEEVKAEVANGKTVEEVEEKIVDSKPQPITQIIVPANTPSESLAQSVPAFSKAKYDKMVAANDARVAELREAISKVEKDDGGELELLQARVKLGEYYAEIGDRFNAILTLRKAAETTSTGAKIDILFTIVRLGFFYLDCAFVGRELEAVKVLIERGGDWERRNKYKTYWGLHCLSIRKFEEASSCLIDSLSTFTSVEIASYEEIVEYAIIAGAVALDRVDLKRKIIDSPEVLSLLPTTPALGPIATLTNSLYTAEYSVLFTSLAQLETQSLRPSKYLAPHRAFYVREMRRKAYAQLLESYKTLSLKSMANAFGVSSQFLDNDLSKFISQNKLNCVIDRVNGIIETNRPDSKNAQYQALIKQGDALLTKLQKYGAAVRLSGAEK
ncbi:26S proteasome regulatory subunit RPN7 [Yarrowia sp. C11]|nr:26S proteasome regulatory subunit RPN7 [Yarrowia sp. E02]KAG5372416.1 26S proteasome regulatory subunit RPN7 [Yarrowia sp. C11]